MKNPMAHTLYTLARHRPTDMYCLIGITVLFVTIWDFGKHYLNLILWLIIR